MEDNTKTIELTQGHVAIVDADDYDDLSQYKWHVNKNSNTFYAQRKQNGKTIKMHRQMSTTIVHVTHDQLTARILADHIGVMQDGVLRQFGPAEDVFHRPADEFVARFVGMENVFDGHAADGPNGARVKADGMVLESATDLRGAVGLCISPEMIHVVTKSGRTFANVREGTVRDVSDRGSVFRVIIDVAGRLLTAHLGRREYEQNPIAAGAAVTIGFDPDDVHCFQAGGA